MAKQRSTPREDSATAAPVSEPAPVASSSSYTVLARRYRPQNFSDLVGQEPVARALSNALSSNRVAHAYLFTGARGVGKTSTARILAKALNCIHGPTPNPCGICDICQSIATGEDVDVLEIDGASNRRIDEIRDIRSNVQYRPSRARFKIYIIDEVHMLTKEAFNALLKTLEEPPSHVKFIFATTEVEKVPITILSRCQRFDFAGIPLPRIVERLRAIVDREGLQADTDALELIARRAGGSMRDAQSLLDQLLAFGGDRLTADGVHQLLGTAGDERILGLVDAILTGDHKRTLDLLDEACVSGLQLGELVDQLLAYWRDLMVVQCGGIEGRDLSVPARHHETLRRHAQAVSLDAILAGLDVLSATRMRLRGSNHARILVEMALIRLGRLNDLTSLTQLASWLGQMRLDPRAAGGGPPTGQLGASRASSAAAAEEVKKKPLAGPESGPLTLSEANWPLLWQQIATALGPIATSQLSKANPPAIIGPNTLVFRFPAGYTKEREYASQPERLARLEEVLSRAIGQTCIVRIEEVSGSENVSQPVLESRSTVPSSRSLKEEVEKIPLIRRAVEVLGATIQRVDEGFGQSEGSA